jgi:hypothetical protein
MIKYPFLVVPFLRIVKASGMALFPFILIRQTVFRHDPVLVNHERIHLRQQLELLVIPFYVLYLLNYLINLVIYFNHDKAYRQICFEKEAYSHESNMDYLKNRRIWGWIKFI